MIYLIIAPVFFMLILLYFRIADHYNIIDHPNERSSHSAVTIRGGGVIFLLAALIGLLWHTKEFYLPAIGLLIIGIISFLDDIYTLPNKLRIAFHFLAVSAVFWFLNVFGLLSVLQLFALYILVIGIINVYNFMDGINGITGAYSLVILAGLQWINIYQTHFIDKDLIWLPFVACLVFLFFNFRKKAKCFLGDVGSVSIALWIATLLLKLILQTNDWIYILFLSVYGVDSVLTILHRLILKQNIFKAHRLHFYQLLANERKVSHLLISAAYSLVQLLIICIIVFCDHSQALLFTGTFLLVLTMTYLIVKPKLMKIKRLSHSEM